MNSNGPVTLIRSCVRNTVIVEKDQSLRIYTMIKKKFTIINLIEQEAAQQLYRMVRIYNLLFGARVLKIKTFMIVMIHWKEV